MNLTEEQANNRLNNSSNLANRFRRQIINGPSPSNVESPSHANEKPESNDKDLEEFPEFPIDALNESELDAKVQEILANQKDDGLIESFLAKSSQVIKKKKVGRKPGIENLTATETNTIAILSRDPYTSQTNVGKEFEVTQTNVSRIETGKNKKVDKEFLQKLDNQIQEKALDRLMTSLSFITDDKLANSDALKLSGIAANMGKVIDKIRPKEKEEKSNVNVIIYAPQSRTESTYKTIEV